MTAIKVPPLGESIVEATISRWLKNEGDQVVPGESIVELETDKITVDVPAMANGVLRKRLKAEGDVVHVDDVLCEIEEGATAAAKPAGEASAAAATSAKPTPAPAAQPSGAAAAAPEAGRTQAPTEQRVSPAAQRTAAERGVDIGQVSGTGRGGVVSKADVIDAQKPAGTAQVPAATSRPASGAAAAPTKPAAIPRANVARASGDRETREKLSTRRRRIAEHLLESQHATAHLTTFNEIDMSAVNALRERHKERVEKQYGVRLSLMPFFVKAACAALEAYPAVNAQLDEDSIVYKHYVNMGIAVASDAGLVVPNLKDVDRKGMIEIANDIVSVAKRAREGKLTMDDLTGGTFTITNGGTFGSRV
jgi:2-oxoglutarate dehydrogenase E2 component (dihydrolipoamide succinyltransferase)